MLEILIATNNLGKVKEIKDILDSPEIKILTMKDFPHLPKIVEDGKTYQENAFKKASKISEYSGKICLADDSGLEIDYLKGKPGLYSSRWGSSDEERINKVLKLLENVLPNKRKAKFVCAAMLVFPDGKIYSVKEECKGSIEFKPKGEHGFGYDPIFLVPEYNKTFAELGYKIKNQISHRGKAMRKIVNIINELAGSE
ncbi:non-canonical purine NTP pyrophosphatase, RdgB/HAM1 family [Candidatus Atribacteria bacterium RBG_19FT_COMBO_35_14]|uniref:dITP/XTP pyrophosphatase n=1 Tax=Candidatus Sediminicultor quintus TaxID=1797291 RepID=A0A1F5ABZ9_9BACT|nr:MAG: non-canonical purine NTP pyrophosphatase, RdgB/HAM1 family [Candidatus Atribacteria bacterium RBG_19FT_COMBO_35_14]OGD37486.1 MAG: non-canonical purine NTP pyrophosphatase, RdgB/HAM1 family [Candidatus Atribacteria bacterium RBG_16_35_8]